MSHRTKRTPSRWMDRMRGRHVDPVSIGTQDAKSFYNGCSNKQAFVSKKIAEGIRRTMMNRATSEVAFYSAQMLTAYKCRFCQHYHLGH